MASWGFMIIATVDKMTGPGQTIRDGANFLVAANGNAASIFFNKLETTEIGAFGHSQGATGAMNALINSGGMIKTVLPIELPARIWCVASCVPCRASRKDQYSSWAGRSTRSRRRHRARWSAASNRSPGYYDAVRGRHQGQGDAEGPDAQRRDGPARFVAAQPPCLIGVFGYLGYPTAWMMYQLPADAVARGAFVSGTGEMFSQTVNWEHFTSNIP